MSKQRKIQRLSDRTFSYQQSEVTDDIVNHNSNRNYLYWMSKINSMTPSEVISKLTPDKLIGGYCEDFGLYYAIRYNVDLLMLADLHNLIRIGNRYYDGWNTSGVTKLSELYFVTQDDNLSKLSEKDLLDLLKVDNEWKTYKPLSSNIKIIDKVR